MQEERKDGAVFGLAAYQYRLAVALGIGFVLVGLGLALARDIVLLENAPGPDLVGALQQVDRFFGLDTEGTPPAWYASVLLLLCALRLAVVDATPTGRSRDRLLWRALALGFLLLSLDEVGQLHELSMKPMGELVPDVGVLHFAWVVPGALVVLAAAAATWRLVLALPPRVRNAFLLAATLYVGGALGMEMVGGWYASDPSYAFRTYALITWVEESLEMAGLLVFLRALHLPGLVGVASREARGWQPAPTPAPARVRVGTLSPR